MYMSIFLPITYNIYVIKAAYVSTSWWMSKENMACMHKGMLLIHEGWGAPSSCSKMNETRGHNVKWNKPGPEKKTQEDKNDLFLSNIIYNTDNS